MILKKRKYNSKIFIILLQLIVMTFLFLLLVDKPTIILIRNFIDSLGVDANIQSLLARLYAGFKVMFDLPSFFGLILFAIQVLCATRALDKLLIILTNRDSSNIEKIEMPKHRVESCVLAKNYSYLENQRLLN